MIINFNQLSKLRDENITVCAGWFDMFHIGHLNFLKNAKKHSEKLLVVVMNDIDGKYIKGDSRPIINENQRAEIVDNLKCVDYVLISTPITNNHRYNSLDKKTRLLWDRYIPIIQELKPNNVFSLEETLNLNKLGNYVESMGINVIYSERFDGVSTTDIENKLKIDIMKNEELKYYK